MPILNSQLFANNELTNNSKWNSRVWTIISNAFLAFWGVNTWQTPTLANSWVNLGGASPTFGYRIRDGVVFFRGGIKSGTVYPSVIFTLPTGYRPAQRRNFVCHSLGGGGARVEINANGVVGDVAVIAYMDSGNNTGVIMDNVRFLI